MVKRDLENDVGYQNCKERLPLFFNHFHSTNLEKCEQNEITFLSKYFVAFNVIPSGLRCKS